MSKHSYKIEYCHECDYYYIKDKEECGCNKPNHCLDALKEISKAITKMSPEELQKIFDECKPPEKEHIKCGLLERVINKE